MTGTTRSLIRSIASLDHAIMLGAPCGDICGSLYEHYNTTNVMSPEELINDALTFTDDTVMTIAVAQGLMKGLQLLEAGDSDDWVGDKDAERVLFYSVQDAMVDFGTRYAHAGYPYLSYGQSFYRWLHDDKRRPYGSWGNGSAMRTSYAGWVAVSEREAFALAAIAASVTHNHPRGIAGAQAVTALLYALREGADKPHCKHLAQSYYPECDFMQEFTLDAIRPQYTFDVSCDGSVPVAIEAFLEGESFAQVVSLAISVGGDSDTIAAIAASLAEAVYHMDESLVRQTVSTLDGFLVYSLDTASRFADSRHAAATSTPMR